ncbi:substrate-binding domain-containing protein [Ruminococcaceae bacterium OttesenSCG-928-A16]|nr:substrate-binding domain-containing protein [Ruminococcaceae bacterium OttesenSCG-928-A16]
MRKILALALAACVVALLAACTGEVFSPSSEIVLVSREDGSGTRGAFVELFGVEEKDADGNKIDRTSLEANITSSTSVVMATVAGNPHAMGYISLGSVNNSIKVLAIDGVAASAENVKNGTYKIARPFNIATKGEVSEVTQDFIDYILSDQGQQVVEKAGYIPLAGTAAYNGSRPAGKVVVAGSSSVSPVMEKLKEAYLIINPSVNIEIQQSDSTTGMTSTAEGICDIGMASRELKQSEIEKGLAGQVIAQDGIAVIVNHQNPLMGLTSTQVKTIYIGQIAYWQEVE